MAQSASVQLGDASKYTLIFLAFWRITSTLSHLFSCFDNLTTNLFINFNFSTKSTATCLLCTMPITRPNFLKIPLSFTLSSPLIKLAKHRPFSPSPPLLSALTKSYINSLTNINIKLKS